MPAEFERKESAGGLTVKLYRGEGVALLAFDLDPAQATDDFVGFTVEVRYPGSDNWGVLWNRLHFDYPPNLERPRSFRSTEAPFQKFRWIHVPRDVPPGEFRYRVTARYMNADETLRSGSQVVNAVSLAPQTIDSFLNVGFTRGFARIGRQPVEPGFVVDVQRECVRGVEHVLRKLLRQCRMPFLDFGKAFARR